MTSGFSDDTFRGLNAFRFVARNGSGNVRSLGVRAGAGRQRPRVRLRPGTCGQELPVRRLRGCDPSGARPLAPRRLPRRSRLIPAADATRPWPTERTSVDLGTVIVTATEAEASGNCRDVNFDPLVLPTGIAASDDPLLSARSATYSHSFTRRAGETKTPSAVQVPVGRGIVTWHRIDRSRFFPPAALDHGRPGPGHAVRRRGMVSSVSPYHPLVTLHRPLGIGPDSWRSAWLTAGHPPPHCPRTFRPGSDSRRSARTSCSTS